LQPREVGQDPEVHGLHLLEAHNEPKYTAKDEPIFQHNYEICPSVKLHFQNRWSWQDLCLRQYVHGGARLPFPPIDRELLNFLGVAPSQIDCLEGVSDVYPGILQHLSSYCLSRRSSDLPHSPISDLHLVVRQLFQQQGMVQRIFYISGEWESPTTKPLPVG